MMTVLSYKSGIDAFSRAHSDSFVIRTRMTPSGYTCGVSVSPSHMRKRDTAWNVRPSLAECSSRLRLDHRRGKGFFVSSMGSGGASGADAGNIPDDLPRATIDPRSD